MDNLPDQKNWPADKVERWPIGRLVPYARNARTHSDEQVAQVAASIREWGWTNPVLVSEDGGIIAGHCRVLAGRQLGLSEVPVMLATGWSEAQKRAYVLGDNQLALNAGWNPDLLRQELGELQGLNFDIGLIGFDDAQLAGLLGPNPGLTDPDEVPELPAEPISKLGDIWQLGRHRLLCGDASQANAINKAAVDIIITDPPYSSGARQDTQKRYSSSIGTRSKETIARDNLTTKGYVAMISLVLSHAYAESVYVFTDWRMWTWTYDALEGSGYLVRNMLVWDKEVMGMGFPWRSQHELIAFAKQSSAELIDGKKGNVLKCPRTKNEFHPTQKPVELIQEIIENTHGKIIYDPFVGSGTTIIAAEMTGRACHAIEINPAYCDVTIERWQNFTGEKAVRADAA